jgi:hypothetical protein
MAKLLVRRLLRGSFVFDSITQPSLGQGRINLSTAGKGILNPDRLKVQEFQSQLRRILYSAGKRFRTYKQVTSAYIILATQ